MGIVIDKSRLVNELGADTVVEILLSRLVCGTQYLLCKQHLIWSNVEVVLPSCQDSGGDGPTGTIHRGPPSAWICLLTAVCDCSRELQGQEEQVQWTADLYNQSINFLRSGVAIYCSALAGARRALQAAGHRARKQGT
jgi:hypothetical protein